MPNASPSAPKRANTKGQDVWVRTCLAIGVLACIGIVVFFAGALPWYFTLSPARQFEWFWPFLWITILLTAIALAGSAPAALRARSGRARSAAFFCLVFGLTTLVLFTPALFLALSVLGTSGATIVAKTEQTEKDLVVLAGAVGLFREEKEAYPSWTLDPSRQVPFVSDKPLPTFSVQPDGACEFFSSEDAPSERPRDPFGPREEPGSAYAYWAPPGGHGFVVLGRGPDCKFDIDFETLQREFDPTRSDQPGLRILTYDPSNGLVSAGDLWAQGPDIDSEAEKDSDDVAK